jgi:hypothetical protein
MVDSCTLLSLGDEGPCIVALMDGYCLDFTSTEQARQWKQQALDQVEALIYKGALRKVPSALDRQCRLDALTR